MWKRWEVEGVRLQILLDSHTRKNHTVLNPQAVEAMAEEILESWPKPTTRQ